MFEQSPTLGPGMGSVTEHTAEIFLLLAGAFALGMVLRWLLSRGTAVRLRQQTQELAKLKDRLATAERRPMPTARLRESNSTEHERTLNQLRDSRETEARARERILELEGRIALLEAEQAALQHAQSRSAAPAPDPMATILDLTTSAPADAPEQVSRPRKKST